MTTRPICCEPPFDPGSAPTYGAGGPVDGHQRDQAVARLPVDLARINIVKNLNTPVAELVIRGGWVLGCTKGHIRSPSVSPLVSGCRQVSGYAMSRIRWLADGLAATGPPRDAR